jgi:tetratricopeptide (TPR) repeat protein
MIPTIESRYRIDSDNRTLYGYSLGGLFSLYALFTSPELFRNYIAASFVTKSRKGFSIVEYEEQYFANKKDIRATLYAGAGEYESPEVLSFAQRVKDRNYQGLTVFMEEYERTGHWDVGNASSLAFGLSTVFNKQSVFVEIVREYKQNGFDNCLDYYFDLKKNSARLYNFQEGELDRLGYYFFDRQRYAEAVEIFRLRVQEFPDSWEAYESFGEAYGATGDLENAISSYEKALALNPEDESIMEILDRLKSQQ